MSQEAIYLVGGAVRDELLGLPVGERDFVVTGGTPESLERRGFRRVGQSFPVFLHPETGEQYALARTERKEGHGYTGFVVDFHPGVTIEQDLERRDLTINAMARTADGSLIDPFGGQQDLQRRVLRHVSPAFAEDPLRVLRVARFAARFEALGFEVHPETLDVMKQITRSGELSHLVAERIWTELVRGLETPRPSRFIEMLRVCGALIELMPEVDALFGVPQPHRFHPEVDTGIHVLLALDFAAQQGWSPEVRFAVLVHDLGKGLTPREEWPSHRGHETTGVPLVEALCVRLKAPNAYRELGLMACQLHLRFHRALELRPGKVLELLEAADLLRRPERFEPLARACEADYRGREGWSGRDYPQAAFLQRALAAATRVAYSEVDTEGLKGPQIAERMHQARIAAIANLTADS